MRALCWREGALVTRNPADVAGRALVFSWSGLVVGAVFYALAHNVHGLQCVGGARARGGGVRAGVQAWACVPVGMVAC